MPANNYFDSVYDPTTEGVLEDPRAKQDPFVRDALANLPAITPKKNTMPFYEAAGFQRDPNNPDNVVTPSRAFVDHKVQQEYAYQDKLRQDYEKTKGSALFKIGDTLADTGRLFLSPLFWLGGEDTTKYDPSAQLDAGYKREMTHSKTLTEGLYGKLLAARDARQLQMQNVQKDYIARQKGLLDIASGNSAESKAMYDFAAKTNQLDIYNQNTPESYDLINKQMLVATGEAFAVGKDRVMMKPVFEKLTAIGNKFETQASKVTEAYSGYKSLMESLTGPASGFSDIAAVFSFMKALDPRSVVREGEFRMAAGASGVFDKLFNLGKQVENGELLPEKARGQMMELARRLIGHWEDSYSGLRANYENKINYLSDSPEDIDVFLGSRVEMPEFQAAETEYPQVNSIPEYIRRPPEGGYQPQQNNPTDFTTLPNDELDKWILGQEALLNGK